VTFSETLSIATTRRSAGGRARQPQHRAAVERLRDVMQRQGGLAQQAGLTTLLD